MSMEPVWDNDERTILRLMCSGEWSSEEFFESYNQSRMMMSQVDHPIVLIIDMTRSGNPPSTLR